MIRQRLAQCLSTPAGLQRARDAAFLAVLFAGVAMAFGPSLKHPPRADQWCFLSDTRNDHTFLNILRNTYSYNRTRVAGAGDTDLFRPVLFAVLAAERAAFEGHISPPQVVGIVLHCAVCALMLVLVRQVSAVARPVAETPADGPDWFTYGLLTFFAINPYTQELVIWAHLHGYLVFLVLVLGSMSCLFRYATGGGARWLWGAWALALVSAFTYELGQLYAVLAGASAAVLAAPRIGAPRAAGIAAGFATILGAYQTINRIDVHVHLDQHQPENLKPLILRHALTKQTLVHSARYITFTAVQPFFPSLVQHSYAGQRLEVAENLWRTRRHVKMPTPVSALSLAVFAGCVGLGIAGLRQLAREPSRAGAVAFVLPVALYALYGAITVLGRMNMRPTPTILSANSYYAYTALAFGLLAAAAAWSAVGSRGAGARKWLAVGFFLLAAVGSDRVWQANVMIAKLDRDWARPLEAVQALVDERRDEPGFGFEIDYAVSDPVPTIHRRLLPDIVFAEWMPANPRYRVVIRDGVARATPRE